MSSVVLNEEIDDNYEPKEEELFEYAKFLGMVFPEDEEFLYIAREGLKAPLPEPWKPCQTKSGDIYFFNFDTGESVWEHPCDTYYKDLFTDTKNKKKVQTKKPPLQEPKIPLKKPIMGLPKSISPVSFDKKRDVLTEFIQLEKETKESKSSLKDKLESELSSYIRDLNIQRDLDLKAFMDSLEKENKKKTESQIRELEELESKERKLFGFRLEEKLEQLKQDQEEILDQERKKIKDRVDREIVLFEKDLALKHEKNLEEEKKFYDNERKNLLRQIEEHNDNYEKQKKANSRLEEDLKEELKKEEEKIKRENQRRLEEFQRDKEYEVQKAMLSARNKKSLSSLQEKIRELKEEYKVKEECEVRYVKREFEEEWRLLQERLEKASDSFDKQDWEIEKMYQLDELSNKYKTRKQEEFLAIDKEFDKKLALEKELIEQEMKAKVSNFTSAESMNFSALEQKINELSREVAYAKEKLKATEDCVQRVRLNNLDLQKRQEGIKRRNESQLENLPESTKIAELRYKLQEKDQIIERLRLSAPEKLLRLENEIREIRNLFKTGSKSRPYFTAEESVKKKPTERRSESRPREDYHERLDDDELLIDWRKGEDNSWNLSRDISPVDLRMNNKRPQIPSRAWVKPREDLGRFSAF